MRRAVFPAADGHDEYAFAEHRQKIAGGIYGASSQRIIFYSHPVDFGAVEGTLRRAGGPADRGCVRVFDGAADRGMVFYKTSERGCCSGKIGECK